jgi:hypothetical protein
MIIVSIMGISMYQELIERTRSSLLRERRTHHRGICDG